MNTDLIIAVLSLAGIQIGLIAWLRSDIRRMEDWFRRDMQRIDDRLSALEIRLSAVEHSQAHLEGLLEGLREAIVARAA